MKLQTTIWFLIFFQILSFNLFSQMSPSTTCDPPTAYRLLSWKPDPLVIGSPPSLLVCPSQIFDNGNQVGIGISTSLPTAGMKLDVNGNIKGLDFYSNKVYAANIEPILGSSYLNIGSIPSVGYYPAINFLSESYFSQRLYAFNGATIGGTHIVNGVSTFNNTTTINADTRISTKLTIGNLTPIGTYSGYKLGVDGIIVSKEVIVQVSDWADKVFKKEYHLMPITQVKEFIQTNHHLPNIPSEKDAINNGVSLNDMTILLLQKVEELTLYTIQLKDELEIQKRIIENLKK